MINVKCVYPEGDGEGFGFVLWVGLDPDVDIGAGLAASSVFLTSSFNGEVLNTFFSTGVKVVGFSATAAPDASCRLANWIRAMSSN